MRQLIITLAVVCASKFAFAEETSTRKFEPDTNQMTKNHLDDYHPDLLNHERINEILTIAEAELGRKGLDACGAGRLTGLSQKSEGDRFLGVWSKPSVKSKMIDKLVSNGFEVFWCAETGDWAGIIYHPVNGLHADCNQDNPSRFCRSGWVHKSYLKPFGC